MTNPPAINVAHNAVYVEMTEKPSLNATLVRIATADGRFTIQAPRNLFPFIEPNQSVIVTVAITRVAIEAEQAPAASLIIPGEFKVQ